MILTPRDEQYLEHLKTEFESLQDDRVKLRRYIKNFCAKFLTDRQSRPLRLTSMQYDIIENALTQQNVVLLAPRGSGKSYALGVAATMWLFFKPVGENVFIVSPGDAQSAVIFQYVLANFLNSEQLRSLVDSYRERNIPQLKLKYGSTLKPRPVSPTNKGKSIRGQHATYMIVDESPHIDDDLFEDNVEPAVVRHRAPFINIGTPNNKDNHVWRYMFDDTYSHFTRLKYNYIDAMDLGDAYESCYSADEMDVKIRTWGVQSVKFRKEYMCEFVDSEGTLFTEQELEPLYSTRESNYDLFSLEEWPDLNGECIVSVDIGRRINSTVVSVFQMWAEGDYSMARLVYCEEWIPKGMGYEFPMQRAMIFDICDKVGAIGLVIDATGMGVGQLDDIVREANEHGIPVTPFKFTIKKGEDYEYYKQLIYSRRLRIPNYKFLKRMGSVNMELMEKAVNQHRYLTYDLSKDNKTLIVGCPKDKHDDIPDSFVMFAVSFLEPIASTGHVIGVTRKSEADSVVQEVKKFKNLPTEFNMATKRNDFSLNKGKSYRR